jgi:hypothetical protein
MDFTTSLHHLIAETKRQAASDIDMATIAMMDAMNYYKGKRFSFNHGWQQVFLPAGSDRITSLPSPIGNPSMRAGLPHGLIRPIVIQVAGIVTEGNVQTGIGTFAYTPVLRDPLVQLSVEELWSLQGGPGQLRSTSTGYPTYYAWLGGVDGSSNSIRVSPAPNADLVLDVFFTIDSHRPRYRWDATIDTPSWVFEQLETNSSTTFGFWQWTALRPEFSNLWLDNAEALIRARARWDLWLNYYHDEGAAKLARVNLEEEERKLDYERIQGHIGQISRSPTSL